MTKHPLGTSIPWGESFWGFFHWRRVWTSISGGGENYPWLFLELVPNHFFWSGARGRTWAYLWGVMSNLGWKGGFCELWSWPRASNLIVVTSTHTTQLAEIWWQAEGASLDHCIRFRLVELRKPNTHIQFNKWQFSMLCPESGVWGDPKPDDGQSSRDWPWPVGENEAWLSLYNEQTGPSAKAEAETKCPGNFGGEEEMSFTQVVLEAFLEDGDSQLILEVAVY